MQVEKAVYENKEERLVLLDKDYNIVEEVLLFSNYLYATGCSANTIESYLYDLKLFYQFLNEAQLIFKDIRPSHISKYIGFLLERVGRQKESLEPTTINRKLAAVSSFYHYRESVFGDVASPFKMVGCRRPSSMSRDMFYHTHKGTGAYRNYFTRKVPRKLIIRLTLNQVLIAREGFSSDRDRLIFDILYESLHSTSLYAKVRDEALDRDYRKIGFVGITAKTIIDGVGAAFTPPKAITGALPDGVCSKAFEGESACGKFNKCLLCPKFITTPEYLEIHKDHLRRLQQDKAQYMMDSYICNIEKVERIEAALRTIIRQLEELR
jgi:hypothetical protein